MVDSARGFLPASHPLAPISPLDDPPGRVADGNPASLRLHGALGFRPVGTMRRVGEKFGRILDVTLLDLHLDGG